MIVFPQRKRNFLADYRSTLIEIHSLEVVLITPNFPAIVVLVLSKVQIHN